MIHCKECGKEYDSSIKYCPYCGNVTEIPSAAAAGSETPRAAVPEAPASEPPSAEGFENITSPQQKTGPLTSYAPVIDPPPQEWDAPPAPPAYAPEAPVHSSGSSAYAAEDDFSRTFDRSFSDNSSRPSFYNEMLNERSDSPIQPKSFFEKAEEKIKTGFISSEAAAHSFIAPLTKKQREFNIKEVGSVLLGVLLPTLFWAFISGCGAAMPFAFIPGFIVVIFIVACSTKAHYKTAFDNILVITITGIMGYYSLMSSYANGFTGLGWTAAAIIAACSLGAYFLPIIKKSEPKRENQILAGLYVLTALLTVILSATEMNDKDLIVFLFSLLACMTLILITVFEEFGRPILLFTLLPAVGELFFFKILHRINIPDSVVFYILIALLFVPVCISLEFTSNKTKKDGFYATALIFCQVVRLIIFTAVSASSQDFYIKLFPILFSSDTLIYAGILLATDTAYLLIRTAVIKGKNKKQ